MAGGWLTVSAKVQDGSLDLLIGLFGCRPKILSRQEPDSSAFISSCWRGRSFYCIYFNLDVPEWYLCTQMLNLTSFLLPHHRLTPVREHNNQMIIGIQTERLPDIRTWNWRAFCALLLEPWRCPPPPMAMFIEPPLICQSTCLLLRDRRTGRLSDCPSAVITFRTTRCFAAPQTPGKLPRPLTFPLEKIHVEMAVTGWHSTVMWIYDAPLEYVYGGLPQSLRA